jgi:soluble lytic murein transglycosylase-like protein
MMPASDEFAYTQSPTLAELKAWGQQVAAQFQVPWPIFDAMITYESGWSTSPAEVSSAGAQGIAQIMPGTASDWNVNPWDPYAALSAAAQHLSEYYTQFGNSWSNALAAYNGGASPQGMRAAYNGGYPQHVLGVAQQLGADVSAYVSPLTSGSSSSPAASSSSSPAPSPITLSQGVLYAIVAGAAILVLVGIAVA